MFRGEFIPFRLIRQSQREWQETLNKEINRRTGRRNRWDIPFEWVTNQISPGPATSPADQARLKQIIRKNGR